MKAKPGTIPVATAGVTSAGHNAMELIAKATGVTYRHVTYDGGNPAVVATVAGEAEVTTQLAVEQADMIRGKRLRPLATVSDKPLELEGYGTIPPLSQTLPGFTAPANYFGIFIPKGVPDDVVKTVEKIWAENIAKSEALKKYATSRGALFAPVVRRRGAEGGVPGGAGQRLAAVRRRQGEGLARHRRHPEALTRAIAERAMSTQRRRRRRATCRPTERAPSPRASCAAALGWIAVRRRRARSRSLAHGPARGAAHQSVHRAGPAAGPARHRDDPARRPAGAAQLAPRRARCVRGPRFALDAASRRGGSRSCIGLIVWPTRVVLVGHGLPFWLGAAIFVDARRSSCCRRRSAPPKGAG